MMGQIYTQSWQIASDVAETVASTSLGQTLLKNLDRFLWTIEKSTGWFLPVSSTISTGADENESPNDPKIVRPLPWVLFIPMLLFLRISRTSVNMGMFLLGLEPIHATTVIRFIHSRRRKIRAVRFAGLRKIRERKVRTHSIQRESRSNNWKQQFRNKLYSAFCMSRINYKEMRQSDSESFVYKSDKRKYQEDETSSDEVSEISESSDGGPIIAESVMEKLRKFANANSDSDPDYKPDESELLTDDTIESVEEISDENESIDNRNKNDTGQNTRVEDNTTKRIVEEAIINNSNKTSDHDEKQTNMKQVNSNNIAIGDEHKSNNLLVVTNDDINKEPGSSDSKSNISTAHDKQNRAENSESDNSKTNSNKNLLNFKSPPEEIGQSSSSNNQRSDLDLSQKSQRKQLDAQTDSPVKSTESDTNTIKENSNRKN